MYKICVLYIFLNDKILINNKNVILANILFILGENFISFFLNKIIPEL